MLFQGFEGGLKSDPQSDDKQMVVNVFPKNGLRIAGTLLASVMLGGCGSAGFELQGVLESRPVKLDGEQVIVDQGQVECGAHEDLWNIAPLGDGRSVGRLTQKGRDLQFSDDVQIGDPLVGMAYVQLHGSFSLRMNQPGSIKDEDDWDKVADAKVGVKIAHSCFEGSPPVLMGIRHGQFDQTVNPVFHFRLDGDWQVDHIVH